MYWGVSARHSSEERTSYVSEIIHVHISSLLVCLFKKKNISLSFLYPTKLICLSTKKYQLACHCNVKSMHYIHSITVLFVCSIVILTVSFVTCSGIYFVRPTSKKGFLLPERHQLYHKLMTLYRFCRRYTYNCLPVRK